MTSSRLSTREIEVKLDADKLAVWPVKKIYRAKIDIMSEFLQRPEIEKDAKGLTHPLLRISSAKMTPCVRQELVQKLYGHVKDPELRFRQFICILGIRSRVVHKIYTWEFDAESWNRASYRLAPGCDSLGKPRVTFT